MSNNKVQAAETRCENVPESNLLKRDLGKRLQYIQTTISSFGVKFRNWYLAELRGHHMHQNRKQDVNDNNLLTIGDIVIIKDDIVTPRSSWRLAKVESLVVGKDNMVRGAVLSALSKDGTKTRLSRPLQKLVPLEVTENMYNVNSNLSVKIAASSIQPPINLTSSSNETLSTSTCDSKVDNIDTNSKKIESDSCNSAIHFQRKSNRLATKKRPNYFENCTITGEK